MSKKMGFLGKLIGNPADVKSGIGDISGANKAKKEAEAAKAAAAAAGAPSAAGIQKARGLEERQGRIESAAAAAGAVRSDNEADVLGQGYGAKKKRASKDLLGT